VIKLGGYSWRVNELPSYGLDMPLSSLDRYWRCKHCDISLNIFEIRQHIEIEQGVFCPDCHKELVPNLRKKDREVLIFLNNFYTFEYIIK
jgi:hypothetical protein